MMSILIASIFLQLFVYTYMVSTQSTTADVVVFCDDFGDISHSNDGVNWITDASRDTGEWFTPLMATLNDVSASTIFRATCQDNVHTGGFIGQITYEGAEYYSTNPIQSGLWSIISAQIGSTTSLNYETRSNTDAYINSAASFIWNGQNGDTIIFEIKMSDILGYPSPTQDPTPTPTHDPTKCPTAAPTDDPTKNPTLVPTKDPTTLAPTKNPTEIPSLNPSKIPTETPVQDGQVVVRTTVTPNSTVDAQVVMPQKPTVISKEIVIIGIGSVVFLMLGCCAFSLFWYYRKMLNQVRMMAKGGVDANVDAVEGVATDTQLQSVASVSEVVGVQSNVIAALAIGLPQQPIADTGFVDEGTVHVGEKRGSESETDSDSLWDGHNENNRNNENVTSGVVNENVTAGVVDENVGKIMVNTCVDCGEEKRGRMYDANLFYCFECWECYEDESGKCQPADTVSQQ